MDERITLDCGNGTKATYDLIKDLFIARLSNPVLVELSDAASLGREVFSCDGFTVKPIFFPSSDIGKLAVYGTVNDICVSAAVPRYLSLGVIVEEGFRRRDLEKIVDSLRFAASGCGVKIVCGDFKVVEKKKADKIFITTSGIGYKIKGRDPSPKKIEDKDEIIITGSIAEHGIAVMLARHKMFDSDIESDCQSLKDIVVPLWKEFPSIRFMRDPTRGGLASVMNEMCRTKNIGIRLIEEKIPLRKNVAAACELLGIDPYYLASEGRAVIVAPPAQARDIVRFLHDRGSLEASRIGRFTKKEKGVIMQTISGGERMLDFSYSFTMPRIC
ncbi:MAG: hydrogenase expression/formation protein HypE [Candidatus Omnitrophota bacterium]